MLMDQCNTTYEMQELKAECQKLGLPVSGKKQELVDRILLAQQEVPAEAAAPTAGAAQEPDAAAAAEAEPADANGHRKHKAIEWAPKAAAAEPAAPAGDAADATAPEAAAEPQVGSKLWKGVAAPSLSAACLQQWRGKCTVPLLCGAACRVIAMRFYSRGRCVPTAASSADSTYYWPPHIRRRERRLLQGRMEQRWLT